MVSWKISRREFQTVIFGGLVCLNAKQVQGADSNAQHGEISDEQVREILYEESEPGKRLQTKAEIRPYWFQKPIGERPSPNWPADNVSFDYAHLLSQPSTEVPFSLTPAVLSQLLELNSFGRRTDLPKVLFGLRGCTLSNDSERTGWGGSHMVRATRPNHIDLKCLIGVWDTTKGAIALFKASTVPVVDLMEKQIEGALRCNMLPTGYHTYSVGPHRGPKQPGAFRQQRALWVHRTKKELAYAANDSANIWDDLDGDLPFDNIHAAMLSSQPKPPYFSSAGCQVVAGAYDKNHRPTGAWAEFRKAAGLTHPPVMVGSEGHTMDDGSPFDYVLLTGKEAQLVAGGSLDSLKALRFGSSGPLVADLQIKLAAKLGGTPNKSGIIDRKTLGDVIRWQVQEKIAPTGIVSAQEAGKLGLAWR